MNWRKLKKLLRKGGPFPGHMMGFVDCADGDDSVDDGILNFAKEIVAEAQKQGEFVALRERYEVFIWPPAPTSKDKT